MDGVTALSLNFLCLALISTLMLGNNGRTVLALYFRK